MRDKNFIQQLHALARGDIFLTTIVTTCVNNLRSNQPTRALKGIVIKKTISTTSCHDREDKNKTTKTTLKTITNNYDEGEFI